MNSMPTPIRAYIRSLDLDAYVVGGAVRDELLGIEHADEDFVVPGVDHAGLRALLEPHGRVEDLEVHGQLVGVRLFSRDREIRRLAPAGIEITPPRAERSTGPGHRHFEILTGGISLEQDLGRRDFTVNAIARRLVTGEIVDPFGGVADVERRVLRTVGDESFQEDPLRILRGLRLVSQLAFTLAPETLERMRRDVGGLAHVSGERIGGGLGADGMGELSKLLLGRDP
ncbi:MAG: CCA tRNA nucleotidyltransferase, partial [Actinobacteria bacterium]|nr:CCA tRNA nucleotidyltransferase [Actinomycetota bacterium]